MEWALQIYHKKRRILSSIERESATTKERTVVAVEEVTDNKSADDEIECHEDED